MSPTTLPASRTAVLTMSALPTTRNVRTAALYRTRRVYQAAMLPWPRCVLFSTTTVWSRSPLQGLSALIVSRTTPHASTMAAQTMIARPTTPNARTAALLVIRLVCLAATSHLNLCAFSNTTTVWFHSPLPGSLERIACRTTRFAPTMARLQRTSAPLTTPNARIAAP